LHDLGSLAQALGQKLSRLFREIQQDRAEFEYTHGRTTVGRILIHDRRHSVIRRDIEEV